MESYKALCVYIQPAWRHAIHANVLPTQSQDIIVSVTLPPSLHYTHPVQPNPVFLTDGLTYFDTNSDVYLTDMEYRQISLS